MGTSAQAVQICGAVFVMAAALGIGGFAIARGRGKTLGVIGLIIGMLGAITLLLVLGFELAVLTVAEVRRGHGRQRSPWLWHCSTSRPS